MLEQIREFASKTVVRWTFVAFLVVIFGLFGIETYFQQPGGGDAVANVGPYRIAQTEFDNALRRQTEMYREQFGANFDASMMENAEIRRGVLDRVINERLLAAGAQEAGVRIGDQQLAERIAGMTQFRDAAGRFSPQAYENVARQLGRSPVGLDELIREEMRMTAFRDSIAETAIVPRAAVDAFIRLSEQSREVQLVNFPPEPQLPNVKVTPEQVRAYYDGHKEEFTVPEQIRAEYIELSVDALAAQATADPEEVKKVYESNMARWGQPEQRKASHVLIALKAGGSEADKKAAADKAAAIAAEVRKKPASFADVAKKESADPGSAAQGGDLGFFGKGSMVKPFEDAVFAANKGDIVGPVESEFGFHVIQVTDIRPANVKSLAAATPEIEADVKKAAGMRKMAEFGETFTNGVYEQPTSLKPTADLVKLNVQSTGWFGKAGGAPPILQNPKMIAELFSDNTLKAKRNTAAIEVRPNVLVSARVAEHKPSELRPFEQVSAQIERRLQREGALKLAQAEGEAKLKEAQAGKDGVVTWPAPLAVNRQKPGGLMPPVLDAAFKVDAKKLPAVIGVSTPAGYSLVRVGKVIEIETIDEGRRTGLATQLRSAVAAQELEASLASVRNRIGVHVRRDALEIKDPAAQGQPGAPARPGPPTRLGS